MSQNFPGTLQRLRSVWPDWEIFRCLVNFLEPCGNDFQHKLPTHFGLFLIMCHYTGDNIFGPLFIDILLTSSGTNTIKLFCCNWTVNLHHQDEIVLIHSIKHKYVHLNPHWASHPIHQNLAIILWQFICAKNCFILIPGCPDYGGQVSTYLPWNSLMIVSLDAMVVADAEKMYSF